MHARLTGSVVDIVPLDATAHAEDLWNALRGPENDTLWLYLSDGPYGDYASFLASLEKKATSSDPCFHAVLDKHTRSAVGHIALMRIEPAHKCIEAGHILYTPPFQRTRGATEAMYLLCRYVFESLGYRRFEWKCNALNEPSRRAALRFGFTFEGIFRQHMMIKGRSRDTAWFSMLDSEWPARRREFERWLDTSNFDANGKQKSRLNHSVVAPELQ